MLSVKEAQKRILSHIKPLEVVTVPLSQVIGGVLAEDIIAETPLPPFDNSSMDGFAVIATDLEGASPDTPRTLKVVADIPAGHPVEVTLRSGQAARIMTGAPVPSGADAVIPVEDTDFNQRDPGAPPPDAVTCYRPVTPGENIRPRGQDVQAGEHILPAGHALRPQDIGFLAMLGVTQVKIHRRPRVAIFSSGDELLPPDAPLVPGKVHDANSYTLRALVETSGGEAIPLGIVADEREAVRHVLEQAVTHRADLILSSAGVSVGAFDYIRGVIESDGQLDFWRVNMRPGKPLAFGKYRDIPFIGLPGNPVSAFMGFEVFVRPILEKMSGREIQARPRRRVRLGEPVASDGRESYLRAIVREEDGTPTAYLTGHQGSGNLRSLVQANALLIIPAGVKSLPTGAETDAWLLS